MSFGPQAIVVVSLAAEIAGQVIVVGPQIDGPPLAQGFEHEGPDVEVLVIEGVRAGLDADEQRPGSFQRLRSVATSTFRQYLSSGKPAAAGSVPGD